MKNILAEKYLKKVAESPLEASWKMIGLLLRSQKKRPVKINSVMGLRDFNDHFSEQYTFASLQFLQSMSLKLLHRNREYVWRVEQAIDRVVNGTFGRCGQCEEPIGASRLRVHPTASLCVGCKQSEERTVSQKGNL